MYDNSFKMVFEATMTPTTENLLPAQWRSPYLPVQYQSLQHNIHKRGQIENWELATFIKKSYNPFSVAIYLIRKSFLRAHPKNKYFRVN